MLHVALIWLAASEGRVEVAARLLGWRDARQRARSEGESGATIQRALLRLSEERLALPLGDPSLIQRAVDRLVRTLTLPTI